MSSEFAKQLLNWYDVHQRKLPWRGTRDPYRIWVSEVMLQQTQVDTVIPYYRRWLKRFPTLRALAEASQQEVLALWEGLGYYSRARNLHRAAQAVMRDHGGRLPRSVDELRALPGVGRYTAGAIASIAFNQPAAALDGNVKRVLARVFNYTGDVKTPRGENDLWALAESLLPAERPGDHNQALMDLGALICTPRAPACLLCPVRALCQAQQLGVQEARPITRPRLPVPHHTMLVGVVYKRGRVLLVQRPADDLLGGLWAFPSVRAADGQPQAQGLQRGMRASLGVRVRVGEHIHTLRHAYSHFRVTAHVFDCAWQAGQPKARLRVKWAPIRTLPDYPMGKIDRRIAQHLCR